MSQSLLIDHIGELTTNDAETGGRLTDAAVVVADGVIAWVGPAGSAPAADERVDAAGGAVLPGWVDSHTHLVFAGDRTAEFEARMAGEAYAAGGINVTVAATRAASDAELAANLAGLVAEARRGGTTTLETKTGYGLTVADEVRSAQIAGEQVDAVTFLGAHLVPADADPDAYLDLVTGQMLEEVAPHVSAVDVFCEEGAFDRAASERVLAAARARGLATRMHGNQLGHGPGVELAVAHGSLSVDHVGFLSDADVAALAGSWSGWDRAAASGARGTVATVLPACDLSTRVPLAPARRLLDAGVEVAIASNCNPGTSYTSSMAFCVATAVLQMRLTVPEAVRAATLGGAIALGMHEDGWLDPRGVAQPRVGVIAPGARADLQLLDAPAATHLAYRPGMPLTSAVWRAGERVA
ncbi:imidazolonepropionase [Leucobacter luti]|uniref:Imidazolonepropionase n=1 Tax=Leucobacter luti TaxID=340320 RepID=A0A4V6MCV5_9MICO|nr:imidazolonepropionase [Leucobacter luti]MBL3698515.1 imidazolonepropionase [Leucobacter luti]RZT65889.1 imidazolonepropionase [Leucobacter luti]